MVFSRNPNIDSHHYKSSMQTKILSLLLSLLFLSSCGQTLYTYRLPNEKEKKRYAVDSLKWTFDANVLKAIPVVGDDGKVMRLAVTPKTKIEIRTSYQDMYRFYLQSIRVSGGEALIGSGDSWTGYDLIQHAERTILSREIMSLSIISDEKAMTPVGMR